MKKNILYLHNSNFNKPVANCIQVTSMCNGFNNSNLNVFLFGFGNYESNFYSNYNLSKKVKLKLIDSNFNYYLRTFQLFYLFIKSKNNFDLVYTRDLFLSYLIKLFYPKQKVVYELHEIIEKKIWLKLFFLTINKIDKLVVISNGLKKLVEDNFKINNSIVLPDAVNLNLFEVNKINSKYIDSKKKLVLYSGSFKNWKGSDLFLEVSKINENPDLIFGFLGASSNEIISLKKKFPKVVFFDRVNSKDVASYLKLADILVIPNSAKYNISKFYTSPLKLFEYLASKTPIIASDLPSIREIVSEKEVLFFDPDNKIDLNSKINKLLADVILSKKLSQSAYNLVKKYSWDNRAEKIINLFDI